MVGPPQGDDEAVVVLEGVEVSEVTTEELMTI